MCEKWRERKLEFAWDAGRVFLVGLCCFGACVCVEVAECVAGFIENIFDVVFVCWQDSKF